MTGWLAPERIAKLRQKQETAFAPIFLHRPLAILFLIPTADIPWITPNGLTTVSILMRLVVAYLLLPAAFGGPVASTTLDVVAVILWNVGTVLDAMDGALARYRGQSSAFGRYYDKVSDRVISLALVLAMALRPFSVDGDVLPIVLGMVYVSLTGTTSVAKWIEIGIRADYGAQGGAADPYEVAAPERTFVDWVKYLFVSLRTLFVVSEVDIPLWGSVAVLLHKERWLFAYLGAFIVPYTLLTLGLRGYRLIQLDRDRARAKDTQPRGADEP